MFFYIDTLLDLKKHYAMKTALKKIDGTDYLFIEEGQIPRGVQAGWKPEFLVFKRK